jgi:hypothetical protein
MNMIEIVKNYDEQRDIILADIANVEWDVFTQDAVLALQDGKLPDEPTVSFEHFIEDLPTDVAFNLIVALQKTSEGNEWIGKSDLIFEWLKRSKDEEKPAAANRITPVAVHYNPIILDVEELKSVLPTHMKYYQNPESKTNSYFHLSFKGESKTCFLGVKINNGAEKDHIVISAQATEAGEEFEKSIDEALDRLQGMLRDKNKQARFDIRKTVAS